MCCVLSAVWASMRERCPSRNLIEPDRAGAVARLPGAKGAATQELALIGKVYRTLCLKPVYIRR